MDNVSREEFYTAMDDIKAEILRTRDAVHAVRNDMQQQELRLATVKFDVEKLKDAAAEHRGWIVNAISAVLGGALTAAVDWWMHR